MPSRIFQFAVPGAPGLGTAGSLSAQLWAWNGSAWATSGGAITTGFLDASSASDGYYALSVSPPDGFVGVVVFSRTDGAAPDTVGTGEFYDEWGIHLPGTYATGAAGNMVARIAGLLGRNYGERNAVFDPTTGLRTSYDVCIYDTEANAALNDGVTGLLYKYPVTRTITSGAVTLAHQREVV